MSMKLEILDGAGKSYFPKVELGFSAAGQGGLAQTIEHLAEFGEAAETAGAAWGDDSTYAGALASLKTWLAEQQAGAKSESATPKAPLASRIKARDAAAAVNAA